MKIWMQGAFVVAVGVALLSATAQAQTDVALSGLRTITSSSSGFGTQQTPHDSEGALIELRHLVNPLVGFEAALSFNLANQSYAPKTGDCGFVCGQPPLEVSGKATEFTGDWVVSAKAGRLRPFLVGGAGFIFNVPGNSPYSTNTVVRPVFVYGGGVDWSFAAHFGLRLQVRGNMTKAPNLTDVYTSTTRYTQIYEPMGGVYYRF